MTASDAERRRHDVHLLLAAADPGDPDDPNGWPRYEELHGDIGPSDVVGCPSESAHRLIINLVRYLCASGDLPAAAHLADTALARWADAEDTAGYLELLRVLVGLLLARGRYQTADQVRQNAMSQIRRDPSLWREEIAILGRVDSVLLRVEGKSEQALAISKRSFDEHVTSRLGRDHPQTFAAAGELVTAYELVGDLRSATELAERTLRSCQALCDRPGHPHPLVLCQQNAMARCLRLCGKYAAAWELVQEARDGYAQLTERGLLHEGHPRLLEHEIDYAAIGRDVGTGLDELEARLQQVQLRCWQALDVNHPLTLAASFTRASILRQIPGREQDAAREAASAERRYHSALPDHPYTYAAQVLLAGIQRQLGVPQEAAEELERTTGNLAAAAGVGHTSTLVAGAALMNALADAGRLPEALTRGRDVYRGMVRDLGPDHPQTLVCAANLALVSVQAQERDGARSAEQSLRRVRDALGPAHRSVRMLADGQRFDLDFTPPPL
jgi:hypothetical protein